jgi:hypothetical protein
MLAIAVGVAPNEMPANPEHMTAASMQPGLQHFTQRKCSY